MMTTNSESVFREYSMIIIIDFIRTDLGDLNNEEATTSFITIVIYWNLNRRFDTNFGKNAILWCYYLLCRRFETQMQKLFGPTFFFSRWHQISDQIVLIAMPRDTVTSELRHAFNVLRRQKIELGMNGMVSTWV